MLTLYTTADKIKGQVWANFNFIWKQSKIKQSNKESFDEVSWNIVANSTDCMQISESMIITSQFHNIVCTLNIRFFIFRTDLLYSVLHILHHQLAIAYSLCDWHQSFMNFTKLQKFHELSHYSSDFHESFTTLLNFTLLMIKLENGPDFPARFNSFSPLSRIQANNSIHVPLHTL